MLLAALLLIAPVCGACMAAAAAGAELLSPRPIQAVRQAVAQARARAAIPAPLTPPSPGAAGPDVASSCLPTFGPGTSEDGNHITPQYARFLAPRLAAQLSPILRRIWRREALAHPL